MKKVLPPLVDFAIPGTTKSLEFFATSGSRLDYSVIKYHLGPYRQVIIFCN